MYALAAYCAQLWPPGPKLNKKNTAAQLNCLTSSKGDYEVAMRTMTTAHNAFFSCVSSAYTYDPDGGMDSVCTYRHTWLGSRLYRH